jgi:hypothetical protein
LPNLPSKACQICHQKHKDLQEVSDIPKVAPWTRPKYDAADENLEPGVPGEFGLDSECMFNELSQCISEIPTDVMHNFCEKVASHDVLSIL